MKGCIFMYSNGNHASKGKHTKHDVTSPEIEAHSASGKNRTKNPPGVNMPSEDEMSPAQLG